MSCLRNFAVKSLSDASTHVAAQRKHLLAPTWNLLTCFTGVLHGPQPRSPGAGTCFPAPTTKSFKTSSKNREVFKSEYEIPIPKTDFFNFLLGDISGYEDKTALTDGVTGKSLTYGLLRAQCKKTGESLTQRGYRKGDVVAIYSPNLTEYLLTIYGCASVGITVTLMNPLANAAAVKHQTEETRAVAMFVFPKFAEIAFEVKSDVPRLRDIFIYGAPFVAGPTLKLYMNVMHQSNPYWLFTELLNPSSGKSGFIRSPWVAEEPTFSPEEDILALPYSSGTTGLPKGVVHSHTTAIAYVEQVAQNPNLEVKDNNFRFLALLPMFHIFGFLLPSICLRRRGFIAINPLYSKRLMIKTIQDHKLNVVPVVPPLVKMLALDPLPGKYNLSSMELLFCAGAPLSKDIIGIVEERFPGSRVVQALGMTEGLMTLTLKPDVPHGSVGNLAANVKMKIVDLETRAELGRNEQGEFLLQTPSSLVAYHNNPEATEGTFEADKDGNKWLLTGDVGYIDDNDHIYITDRIKEMIKYKGHQISPVEIEQMIATMVEVTDAAVTGKPHGDIGELTVAFVVKKEGTDIQPEDVTAYIVKKMSYQNQLRGGVIFVDTIPRNLAGKIERLKLKKMIEELNS